MTRLLKDSNKIITLFYDDRTQGIKAALNISKKNDVIAILGKGREKYQDIKGKKVIHSDLETIKEFYCE